MLVLATRPGWIWSGLKSTPNFYLKYHKVHFVIWIYPTNNNIKYKMELWTNVSLKLYLTQIWKIWNRIWRKPIPWSAIPFRSFHIPPINSVMNTPLWKRLELLLLVIYAAAFYLLIIRRSLQIAHGTTITSLLHSAISFSMSQPTIPSSYFSFDSQITPWIWSVWGLDGFRIASM